MTGFKSKRAAALDEDGMYLVHQTNHSDDNPIHEAMLAYWGERCPDHHQECVCCQAWEQYDGKKSAQRPWVDLTPQDLNEIFAVASTGEHAVNLAADKLKEKNT